MKRYFIATLSGIIALSLLISCKKSKTDPPPDPPVIPPGDTIIIPGVDPATANTIGFFLDDWQPKTFTAPSYIGDLFQPLHQLP